MGVLTYIFFSFRLILSLCVYVCQKYRTYIHICIFEYIYIHVHIFIFMFFDCFLLWLLVSGVMLISLVLKS